jgi:hypothetical protein
MQRMYTNQVLERAWIETAKNLLQQVKSFGVCALLLVLIQPC